MISTFIWWVGVVAILLSVVGVLSLLAILVVRYFLEAANNFGFFVSYILFCTKYGSRNPATWRRPKRDSEQETLLKNAAYVAGLYLREVL